ncbi:MAG: CotH kinase family protein [Bacteroidales bacterium]|nr:CotH kinase family protein [Bacteroidales bacterium]
MKKVSHFYALAMTQKVVIGSLLVLLTLLSTPSISQDFYSPGTVNTIDITFTEPNWKEILWGYYVAGNDQRLLAHAIINGESFDSVGVKYKGTSSCDSSFAKNPFNIKLDYVIKDQKIDGYGTLKLSNGFMDPSFTREVLSYEIARKYMPAPRSNYIKVFINGIYHGLYVSSQSEDKEFLKQNFLGYKKGSFFKGEFDQDFFSPACPMALPRIWEQIADSLCALRYYEIESDHGWADLLEFLDVFNNNPEQMESVLNVDQLLWMISFDNLLVNLDAPINVPHNFYLYQDQTDRFNPLVWDLNMAFGGYTQLGGPFGQVLTDTELQQLNIFLYESDSNYPIIKNVLSNPRYRKMYVAHLKTMMDQMFAGGWYDTRIGELQNLISQDVQADQNKFFSYADFLANGSVAAGGIIGIKQLMEARIDYLLAQGALSAEGPALSNIVITPQNDANTVTVTIQDAQYAYLGYRILPGEIFQKSEMFDDGNHGDGAAGDGTWGCIISGQIEGMQYYLYAENVLAGKFSPERAEHEFYTFNSAGDLVINEALADNVTIQADENGEYDDWIELFNNSNSAIDLGEYGLSNDPENPMKWRFPVGTEIAPNGFLIVWADKDTTQAGLHCNFKLSASGEAVYLSDALGTLVDALTFGSQYPDVAIGRYPNGTGSFTLMVPSYNSVNAQPYGINECELLKPAFTVYPNPAYEWLDIKMGNSGRYPYHIYNPTGTEVKHGVVDQQTRIDVSSWPKGLYCIFINGTTKKIIIR